VHIQTYTQSESSILRSFIGSKPVPLLILGECFLKKSWKLGGRLEDSLPTLEDPRMSAARRRHSILMVESSSELYAGCRIRIRVPLPSIPCLAAAY
jgi:hypothetical protein